MDEKLIEQLNKPLPDWAVKKHPTKTYLSVINPMAVIDRLNDCFGIGQWEFKTTFISCESIAQEKRTAYMSAVHGTLIIPAHGIHIEQYGGSTNDDKGDALKGGATDALTKIASYLGVGASIYKGQGNRAPNTDEAPDEADELPVINRR